MTLERKSKTDPVIFPANRPTVSTPGGSYRVIRLLGRGTMASVYLAEQVSMARPVALKILSSSLSNDPEFIERFLREARVSARLNHPNIVAAIDFGEFESRFFLAMEFVDGDPLSTVLARDGAMDEKRVLGIGRQAIAALEHAAGHGVIHLDVKPANIMIRKDGRVKLADFGLAVILEHPGSAEASRKAVGTPYYMSPEQVEGGRLDWRTDQYSLGAALYEAATGVKPFRGSSVSDILMKRLFEKPRPACLAGKRRVSRYFSAVLAKMLSRAPDGRYGTFGEMAADFELVAAGKPPKHARMSLNNQPGAPSAGAWNSFGEGGAIGRVDGMTRRLRWNLAGLSSVLFLALLGVYAGLHRRELAGAVPRSPVRYELEAEAELPPRDIASIARRRWNDALSRMLDAEKNPNAATMGSALYSLRQIAEARDLAGTAYATAARRNIFFLEERLKTVTAPGEPDQPEQASPAN